MRCCGCGWCRHVITRQVYVNQPGHELATGPSTPKRRPKNAVKIRRKIHAIITSVSNVELEKGRPVFQVRTARSKTASRSIDWALFSIQTQWRRNAIRIRVCRNVENVCNSSKRPVLMQSMYPLSNQEKRPREAEESREKSNAVLHRQHQHTGNVTVRYVYRANCNREGQTSESLRRLT